ncbi:hypothetical protein GA0070613_4174 [Micromonospora inositola]|uniref:Uncharacterized protein n=1 Tax=Micromonospora inositola TaxID=47865 RepID=A0A1C5J7L4_9ACTN|nr:hypothetical protein GA0070613_4174 [Micromonospora inositola]
MFPATLPAGRGETVAQVVLSTTSDGGALHLFDITPKAANGAGQASQQVVPADDGVDAHADGRLARPERR